MLTTKNRPLLPQALFSRMAQAADSAIERALLQGSHQMIAPPRGEVGFVATVTLGAVGDIAVAWIPLCGQVGLNVGLTGVFCHGSPQVRFTSRLGQPRQCELADLLIVVDVTTAGAQERCAALIQAKMARAAQRVSLSGRSGSVQLDLYQNWHQFDFVDAAYGLSKLNFTVGRRPQDSGTFGVIDRHLKNRASRPPQWTQHAARPAPQITAGAPSLGTFITEMVRGTRAGFGRTATLSLGTDWSKTVDRLLQVTYTRQFSHKATLGPVRPPRGVTAMACLKFATGADELNALWAGTGGRPPYDGIEIREIDDRPAGISILHIGISDDMPAG